jgi:hypothetical protein
MAIGTTNWPASLDDLTTLIRTANAASSTIDTGGVTNVATTIPVVSAASAPADGVAWCGAEAIAYTGKTGTTLTGCTRGFDGTTGAAHTAGDAIYYGPIIAARFRVLQDAILAMQLGSMRARIDAVRNLVDNTSAQAVFPTTYDALTVEAGMTYRFHAVYRLTKGTTSTATWPSFGGTATFTTIVYVTTGSTTNAGSNVALGQNFATSANSILAASANAGTEVRITLDGTFEVNAGGTIIPQVEFQAATGATPTVQIDTFFECWPIGLNPVTSRGPWA